MILSLLLVACDPGPPAPEASKYDFEVGPEMLPGVNCRSCHKPDGPYPDAPEWTVAGTVFADPEGSAGAAGVTVWIEDDAGNELELITNAVGNFYTATPIVAPYRVTVEKDGVSATMPASPPAGGCNACHSTAPVGGAPGTLWVAEDWVSTLTCDGDALVSEDGTAYTCAPYACESGETEDQCRFDCETDDHCAEGATCNEGRCLSGE